MTAVFDDPNLASATGTSPVLGLAGRPGLHRVAAQRLMVGSPAPGAKLTAQVGGMIAGANCAKSNA